jgi:hypothetical protein
MVPLKGPGRRRADEDALELAQIAAERHNVPALQVQRQTILRYLEPKHQRVMKAFIDLACSLRSLRYELDHRRQEPKHRKKRKYGRTRPHHRIASASEIKANGHCSNLFSSKIHFALRLFAPQSDFSS